MADLTGMTLLERRAVASLATLYAFRMLGLFMVLPILALNVDTLPHSSPLLIGVAIGVYGLSQALLQIPFGILSDKIGRKPVIFIGLALFLFGSLVAALADDIYTVILGRLLQGGGAISSTVMALLSDLTQEQNRTKAMASIGVSVGIAFSVAVIIGPMISGVFGGLNGVFYVIAILAVVAMAITQWLVPTPHSTPQVHGDAGTIPKLFKRALYDTQLFRLNIGVFILHFCLMACFVVFPLTIKNNLHLTGNEHWKLYLPVMIVSFLAMLPFIIIGEKRRKMKAVFVGAILLLAISLGVMSASLASPNVIILSFLLFFTAFNLLESTLPSLVSKLAFSGGRGTAMGLYSSSQFFGAFCGGVSGGWLAQHYGAESIYMACALVIGVWMLIALTMKSPNYLSNITLRIAEPHRDSDITRRLQQLKGVKEVLVIDQKIAYLKVDDLELDSSSLKQFAL